MTISARSKPVRAFLKLVNRPGVTQKHLDDVLESGVLETVLDRRADLTDAVAIRGILGLTLTNKEAPIVLRVNFAESLEEMIAPGAYDHRNGYIKEKRFPLDGKGKVNFEARLLYLNCFFASPAVEYHIQKLDSVNPWKPARIEHLLSYGRQFPDRPRWYPIISLGSSLLLNGVCNSPCIYRGVSERHLDLLPESNGFDPECRFLVVREMAS